MNSLEFEVNFAVKVNSGIEDEVCGLIVLVCWPVLVDLCT